MAKESAVSEESGRAASQKQLILIGVMVALLLGVVYFMFLRGGGEEPASSAAPAPAPTTEASPDDDDEPKEEGKAEAPKKKGKGPVETSEVFGGKDPFEPVLDLTAAGGAAGEAPDGTTDGTTTDGTTTDGTTTDGTTTTTTPVVPITPTPPPDDDDDDDDVVKTGYAVKLIKVYNDGGTLKALVRTVKRDSDSKVLHELVSGNRFRQIFKLTSLDKQCGTFLNGNDWFALCEGQRTVFK